MLSSTRAVCVHVCVCVCVCICMCMHVYVCVVYVYIVMNVYVHMYVHIVGSPPDPPFRNQAHTWSATEQIGYRVFTTQVSLVTGLGERDDSVKFTPLASGAIHTVTRPPGCTKARPLCLDSGQL